MILDNLELYNIKGGAFTFSSTTLNALSRLVTTFMELGRMVGSSIRRTLTKTYC